MKVSGDAKLYIREEVEKRIPACALMTEYEKTKSAFNLAASEYQTAMEAKLKEIAKDLSSICAGDEVSVSLNISRKTYGGTDNPTLLDKARLEEKKREIKVDKTTRRIIGELELKGQKADLQALLDNIGKEGM